MAGTPEEPAPASGSKARAAEAPNDEQRPPRQPPGEDAAPSGSPAAGARERTGPVTLERLTKDDGRALILYSSSAPDR